MRLITAPKRDVQRARDDAIGCKRSLPGHQTRVLDAAGSDHVGPFEERRAELLLDQTDPTTDRRLRAMQPIGRTAKPAELRDRDKSADFVDIHTIRKADDQGPYYALDISPEPV